MSKLEYRVEVKGLSELHVACVRHVGPYNRIAEAFDRLQRWAGPRDLLRHPEVKRLAVYRDDTRTTEAQKLRSDACITVPPGTRAEGEVGLMTIPGGKFAVGCFEISVDQFGEAWDALLGEWMPSSGYQSDDRMCYEVYLNDGTRTRTRSSSSTSASPSSRSDATRPPLEGRPARYPSAGSAFPTGAA